MDEFEEMFRELSRQKDESNNKGLDGFEGYSPSEMHYIVRDPFNPMCVVQFADLGAEDLKRIPLLQQVKLLGDIVSREGKLKLTTRGYLPLKVVKELYSTGLMKDELVEFGISKLYREVECMPIHLTHIIAGSSSLFKKSKEVISVTKMGRTLLADENLLLREILKVFFMKFNWAYLDGFDSEMLGSLGGLYSFLLLSKYGSKVRPTIFYSNKYIKAFPSLKEGFEKRENRSTIEERIDHCYSLRTFERFIIFLGIIEFQGRSREADATIYTNDLFDKLVKLKPHQSLSAAN